jgi:hypothetical protein
VPQKIFIASFAAVENSFPSVAALLATKKPGAGLHNAIRGTAMILTVQLTPDNHPHENYHYTTQHCNNCDKKFKVAFGQAGTSTFPIRYCPYCAWTGGQFWTLEQMTYLDCMALNNIQVPNHTCNEPAENGPSNQRQTHCGNNHTEQIKHDGSQQNFFCIICGLRITNKKKRPVRKAKKVTVRRSKRKSGV